LTDISFEQRKAPELLLIIENVHPLAATDIGALLSSVGQDYRQITRGRTLVLTQLKTGSLYAHLQDAYNAIAPYVTDGLEAVKAAKGNKDFARMLRDLFICAKADPSPLRQSRGRRPVGARALAAIAKISVEQQCEITLRHEMPDGEVIDMKVTPVSAIQIRESIRMYTSPQPQRGDTIVSVPRKSDYADAFGLFNGLLSAQDGSGSEADISVAVAALVDSLEALGMGSLVLTMASDLEGKGYSSLARLLRDEAQSRNRDQERPITI
jgi:hypothetical protein